MHPTAIPVPLRRFSLVLVGLLLFGATCSADGPRDRRAFAEQVLATEIARANLRKIYFPDFVDSSGSLSMIGRQFAASLSKLVANKAKAFTVVSRPEAHKYLAKNGWTDHDLSSSGVLAKFSSDFHVDAIIWGSVSVDQGVVLVNLTARNPLWKDIFQTRHEEPLDSNLQADIDAARFGFDYFFPGLDEVSVPKCLTCPIPLIPQALRHAGVDGKVVLSIIITAEGKVADVRLVKDAQPELTREAARAVEGWRFKPAHDPDGQLVPVRMQLEVIFRYN